MWHLQNLQAISEDHFWPANFQAWAIAMSNLQEALIIDSLFDPDRLIAERTWELLQKDVFISPIYSAQETSISAAFLHYLPGASVPRHVHMGFEHIVILHGSQIDGSKCYDKGSLIINGPATAHEIHSPAGCVALGIWEKPIAFEK